MAETEDGMATDLIHAVLIMELMVDMVAGITKAVQIIDRSEEQVAVVEAVNHMDEEAEVLEEETSTKVVEPIINKITKITTVDRCNNHKINIMLNHIKFQYQIVQLEEQHYYQITIRPEWLRQQAKQGICFQSRTRQVRQCMEHWDASQYESLWLEILRRGDAS